MKTKSPITLPAICFGTARGSTWVGPFDGKMPEQLSLEGIESRVAENLLVVDSAARCWRLARIQRDAFVPKWTWLPEGLTPTGWRLYQVEYEWADEPPIPFAEVIERSCAAIRKNPYDWFDEEFLAGEDGVERDEEQLIEECVGQVRRARDIVELEAVLDELMMNRVNNGAATLSDRHWTEEAKHGVEG